MSDGQITILVAAISGIIIGALSVLLYINWSMPKVCELDDGLYGTGDVCDVFENTKDIRVIEL